MAPDEFAFTRLFHCLSGCLYIVFVPCSRMPSSCDFTVECSMPQCDNDVGRKPASHLFGFGMRLIKLKKVDSHLLHCQT